MADYIKREDALERLCSDCIDGCTRHCAEYTMLRSIPAANVVERKHGEWARMSELDYRCSVCNKRTFINRYPLYAYCPNCGADMRKEQDE